MRLHIVPTRTGLIWFRLGLRTFWRQPLALAGLFFLFVAVVSLATFIPYLGNIVTLALLPSATLGLMAATREAEQGKFPMPSILITAFRGGPERLRSALLLGALYGGGFLLVLGISALVDGGEFARLYLTSSSLTPEMLQSTALRNAMWLAMALYLPLSMLFWHAPALVHWHGVSPAKSLFFSLVACWRNLGAFTLYLLAWSGLFLGVSIALFMLGAILGDPDLPGTLIFPIIMLLAAMFFSSIWFTFRDSFVDDSSAA